MGKIAAIILTAGKSSRMGTPKALLPMAGSTFLQHLIKLFQSSPGMSGDSVIVPVVAPDAPSELLRLCPASGRQGEPGSQAPVITAINPDPDRGMFSSVQTGLAKVHHYLNQREGGAGGLPEWDPGAEPGAGAGAELGPETEAETRERRWNGVFITPVDCPGFTGETLTKLVSHLPPEGTGAVVPVYQGAHGHPVLMGSRLARDLLELEPTARLDKALARLARPMVLVPVDDPGVLVDTDTPEDLADFYHMGLHGDTVPE